VIRQAAKLKIISRNGIGYDGVDVAAATERGILVCNAPKSPAEATADLTFALLLAAARRLPQAHEFTRSGEWSRTGMQPPLTLEVYGRKLGLIGFGQIGRAVARRAKGFGMEVVYYDVAAAPAEVEKELGARRMEMEELLEESDFISLHVPLVEKTRGLIGKDEFERMKPEAVLVNASRGPVVDEGALCEALSSGRIAAAGIDVFEMEPPEAKCPLFELENVVLTPHMGSATHATRVLMAREAAGNIVAALVDKKPTNVVNPEVLEKFGWE